MKLGQHASHDIPVLARAMWCWAREMADEASAEAPLADDLRLRDQSSLDADIGGRTRPCAAQAPCLPAAARRRAPEVAAGQLAAQW
eukprot:4164684-Pyramimonas_sp.AAC.1